MTPSTNGESPPSAWLRRFATCIAPDARVLDLACGRGRHARLLAERGCDVVAVDRDEAALHALGAVGGVRVCRLDLESGADWPWAPASFDAVVVTNYLYRPRFDRMCDLIRSGGVLIYETFMLGNERFGKPANPDFLLQPNELLERTQSAFTTIAFEQGEIGTPTRAMRQRLCAVRGDSPGRIPDCG